MKSIFESLKSIQHYPTVLNRIMTSDKDQELKTNLNIEQIGTIMHLELNARLLQERKKPISLSNEQLKLLKKRHPELLDYEIMEKYTAKDPYVILAEMLKEYMKLKVSEDALSINTIKEVIKEKQHDISEYQNVHSSLKEKMGKS